MKNKLGLLKITICAAFLALFAAATFFSSASKTSALQNSADDAGNPQNCAACHQENQHRNIHLKTVRKATVETVKGDFTGENNLETADLKAEMRTNGADFFVKIGEQSYKVEAVVGVKFIEQYVAEKDGEFYSLPVAYNLIEKRWIHLNDADFANKDAEFSRHLQNWKTECAACHQPRENAAPVNFDDFGVSCGACHGNAAEHIESKTSLWARIGFRTENKIVNPQNLSSDASMMICAACHARDLTEQPKIVEGATEKYNLELISAHGQTTFDSEKVWADGANKFSGNEFQSIVRSVCYAQSKSGGHGIAGEKINCANCHSQHETNGEFAATEKSYDRNCISCHSQFSVDASIAEHTKHPLDSEASRCASCHQPETVYGRMRFTRTHEISVPNPVLTVEKQIPNACNLCHTNESANWAIASSKKLWSERFRDAEIPTDKQFDQPEVFRMLRSDDAFLRALANDSLRKHADFSKSVLPSRNAKNSANALSR